MKKFIFLIVFLCINIAGFSYPAVHINEFVPKGTEWVELYNAESYDVDVSSWTINGSEISTGVTIPANGFMFFSSVTNMDTWIGLDNSGEVFDLLTSTGVLIDQVGYGDEGGAPLAPFDAYSCARITDGLNTGATVTDPVADANDFNITEYTTAGVSNNGSVPGVNLGSSLVINEVDNYPPSGGDLVELYNPTGSPIDITGWHICDGDEYNTLAVGITICPGSVYVLVEGVDFTTDFSSSDIHYLFDASGVRVDQIGYAGEFEDFTFQRIPDGAGLHTGYDWASSDGGNTWQDVASTIGLTNQCDGADVTAPDWTPSGQSNVTVSAGPTSDSFIITWDCASDTENVTYYEVHRDERRRDVS